MIPRSRSKYTDQNKKLIMGRGIVRGEGIGDFVNNAIQKLGDYGAELHLYAEKGENVPGGSFNDLNKHSYTGPGTQLIQRLKEGYQGINELDRMAKLHDIFYYLNTDVKSRNISDRALAYKAEQIANDSNTDEIQRKDAKLVMTLLGTKAKFGLGVKTSKN